MAFPKKRWLSCLRFPQDLLSNQPYQLWIEVKYNSGWCTWTMWVCCTHSCVSSGDYRACSVYMESADWHKSACVGTKLCVIYYAVFQLAHAIQDFGGEHWAQDVNCGAGHGQRIFLKIIRIARDQVQRIYCQLNASKFKDLLWIGTSVLAHFHYSSKRLVTSALCR